MQRATAGRMGKLALELYDIGPFVKDFAIGVTWKNRSKRVMRREEKIEGKKKKKIL